jgi:hypothetical protein
LSGVGHGLNFALQDIRRETGFEDESDYNRFRLRA